MYGGRPWNTVEPGGTGLCFGYAYTSGEARMWHNWYTCTVAGRWVEKGEVSVSACHIIASRCSTIWCTDIATIVLSSETDIIIAVPTRTAILAVPGITYLISFLEESVDLDQILFDIVCIRWLFEVGYLWIFARFYQAGRCAGGGVVEYEVHRTTCPSGVVCGGVSVC